MNEHLCRLSGILNDPVTLTTTITTSLKLPSETHADDFQQSDNFQSGIKTFGAHAVLEGKHARKCTFLSSNKTGLPPYSNHESQLRDFPSFPFDLLRASDIIAAIFEQLV
jgi:hypothetical protein